MSFNFQSTFEKLFGFFVAIAIVFFSVNHRWSMAAALIAMLAGFFAVLLTTNHITMVQKSLLKISYLVIFCFLGLIVFFLWYHGSKIRYFDNYSRLLILAPLIYFIVRLHVSNKVFKVAIAIAGLIIFFQAITYSDDWGGRASLVYENALSMSNVAGEFLAIVAAFYLFGESRSKANLLAWGGLGVLLFLTILMTGTKGVWLTTATIMILVFLKLNSAVKRSGFIALLILSTITLNLATNNMPLKRIDSAIDGFSCVLFEDDKFKCQDGSVAVRAWLLIFAVDRFKESPLLGHGAHSYTIEFEKAAVQGEIPSQFAHLDNPHNDFSKFLYDFGLIGLCALLAIFGVCFWIAKQVISYSKPGLSVWAYATVLHATFAIELGLTQSNFSVSSQSYHFAFFTCFLLGLAIKSISCVSPGETSNVRKSHLN